MAGYCVLQPTSVRPLVVLINIAGVASGGSKQTSNQTNPTLDINKEQKHAGKRKNEMVKVSDTIAIGVRMTYQVDLVFLSPSNLVFPSYCERWNNEIWVSL